MEKENERVGEDMSFIMLQFSSGRVGLGVR